MKKILLVSIILCIQMTFAQEKKHVNNHIILAHALAQSPGGLWYPRVKQMMEDKNIMMEIPQLPDPSSPKKLKWLNTITFLADQHPSNTILIGHSLGCVTLLNYLDAYTGKEKFPLLILVAPTVFEVGYDNLKEFFATPFQLNNLKNKVDRVVVILSPTDPVLKPNPLDHGMMMVTEADAKLVVIKKGNHFWDGDDITELYETLSSELSQVIP